MYDFSALKSTAMLYRPLEGGCALLLLNVNVRYRLEFRKGRLWMRFAQCTRTVILLRVALGLARFCAPIK